LLASELAGTILRTELLGVERRRRWTREEKLAILGEIGVDGASVSDIARLHDVPRQNLYLWRREMQQKALSESLGVTFIPVALSPEPQRSPTAGSMGAVEITLRNGRGLRGIAGMAENELTHLIRVVEGA
jgi:transposase